MNFAINESYWPFLYVVLLKAALFFLQRPHHTRQQNSHRPDSNVSAIIDIYCNLTAAVAGILSWGTWVLAIWIGFQFGISTGLLFFVVGLFGSMLLPLVLPIGFVADLTGHLVSFLATPFLVTLIVRSVNLL